MKRKKKFTVEDKILAVVYAVPHLSGEARVMWDYCQEKGGVEPKDLSYEEMN